MKTYALIVVVLLASGCHHRPTPVASGDSIDAAVARSERELAAASTAAP